MLHQSSIIAFLASALVLIKSASAQNPPCPPPGLEAVVDTPEKCMCFYSLAGSGLDLGDSSTFDAVFDENSVQNFSQTGQYVGAAGIAEYLSYVKGGEGGFVKDYILIGTALFLDMTGSTMEQCVATSISAFNSFFAQDNQELCVDAVTGSTLYYTIMTGNLAAPITIQKVNTYVPDEISSGTYPNFAHTQATSELVCDAIVNICGSVNEDGFSARKLKTPKKKTTTSTKKTKAPKRTAPTNPLARVRARLL